MKGTQCFLRFSICLHVLRVNKIQSWLHFQVSHNMNLKICFVNISFHSNPFGVFSLEIHSYWKLFLVSPTDIGEGDTNMLISVLNTGQTISDNQNNVTIFSQLPDINV